MSALSAVQTATTLTPPSSSHGDGNGFSWDFTSAKHENRPYHDKNTLKTDATNGVYRSHHLTRGDNGSALEFDTSSKASSGGDQVNGPGAGAASRSYSNDDDDDSSDDRPDNVVNVPFDDDYHRSGRTQTRSKDHLDMSDEDSKWIHRDLLAKIESQELQAAGITLPQSRSRSRPRRDRSQSSARKPIQDNASRSRKNSSHVMEPKTPDTSEAINGWDSRPIEEADAEGDAPAKPAGGSRIPIPKKSPLPLPTQHMERDKLMKRENSPEELEKRIEMPKARSRSNSTTLKNLEPSPTFKAHPAKRAATTDLSPKKQAAPTGPRKGSAPAKSIPPEARGKVKPKPKNGAASNSGRPSTRSGERELSMSSKPMEGDPPWLVSAYKPDPRLPPDQQLLPTVARRLQQEKWEQEGKFGSIYDKDFRPLTGEGFQVPENMPSSSSDDVVKQEVEKPADDWPLKSPEAAPKSPASPGRSSSYSTMPKIQDKPPASPLSSPKQPSRPVESPEPMQITRVPDMPEKEPEQTGKKEKGGCGCCVVM